MPSVRYSISTLLSRAYDAIQGADTNGSKKLSTTELKKLPPAIQARAAAYRKAMHSLDTDGFAKSYTRELAAALRGADENDSGLLSASERKTLPQSILDVLGVLVGQASAPEPTPAPAPKPAADDFSNATPQKADTLGGVGAQRYEPSSAVSALVSGIGGATSVPFAAGRFTMAPADLSRALSNPATQKHLLNDVLFKITGETYLDGFPDYYTPDGLEEVKPVGKDGLTSYLLPKLSDQGAFDDGGSRPRAVATLEQLGEKVMAGDPTKIYGLTWTNHDDASFIAVVAINERTGDIRGAGFANEP